MTEGFSPIIRAATTFGNIRVIPHWQDGSMATLFDGYGTAHETPRSRKGSPPWDEMFPLFGDRAAPGGA